MNTYEDILKNIKNIFLNESLYGFDKQVWEYKPGGIYVGDTISFSMVEKTSPPTFYHVFSPYDVESNKAPQHALIFRGGKLLFNADFSRFAAMRTGAMDSLVLQNMGITSLKDKKIIIFGRGNTATWSVKFLKHTFSAVPHITVAHSQTPKNGYNLKDYDIILCHTNTQEVLFSDPGEIKEGAVITTFISSKPAGEVPALFYNMNNANIILDWDKNLPLAPEISDNAQLIYFKDFLSGKKRLDSTKHYSIFRFLGTPLQNLAVLKTVIEK